DVTEQSDVRRHVDQARDAIVALNDFLQPRPLVYLQGNVLTRVTTYSGRTRLEPLTETSLTETLSDAAVFARQTKDGPRTIAPPAWVARTLRSRRPSELAGIPQIERVVDVPIFGRDEGRETRAQVEPGYSEATRAYLKPAPDVADGLSR